MSRIISALIILLGLATVAPGALAQAGKAAVLADDAPDRHIVVPGDTLWGISGKFLKDPWRWPEVWRMNKDEVKNPHRIYPGDVIVLDRSSGTLSKAQVIKLEPRVYASGHQSAIPSIPPKVIDPFLTQPLVIEADALDSAPRIVGTQEDRVMVGTGDRIYARGIVDTSVRNWSIYRPGVVLLDSDRKTVLGHEAIFLGTAKLETDEEMSRLLVTSSNQEILPNDRLIPTVRPPLLAYAPHRPNRVVSGDVIAIHSANGEVGGQYHVVALNRGLQDGLEIGNVLALWRAGRSQEKINAEGYKEKIIYPDERYGLLFVFRTFERVAYALVMEASYPLAIGDVVSNP